MKTPRMTPVKQLLRAVVAFTVVLGLGVSPLSALEAQFTYKNTSLSTASTNVPFSIAANTVLIQNRTVTTKIYVDVLGGTANSSDYELDAGAVLRVRAVEASATAGAQYIRDVSVACASGTCDVQILAVR